MNLTALKDIAADLSTRLDETFPDHDPVVRQALAIAEEAGEFVGAIRRYHGMARRNGTFEELRDEWADVVLTAFIGAHVFGIDPDTAITAKVDKIYGRAWKE